MCYFSRYGHFSAPKKEAQLGRILACQSRENRTRKLESAFAHRRELIKFGLTETMHMHIMHFRFTAANVPALPRRGQRCRAPLGWSSLAAAAALVAQTLDQGCRVAVALIEVDGKRGDHKIIALKLGQLQEAQRREERVPAQQEQVWAAHKYVCKTPCGGHSEGRQRRMHRQFWPRYRHLGSPKMQQRAQRGDGRRPS